MIRANPVSVLLQKIKIPLLTSPEELNYFVIHQTRYLIILEEILNLNFPKHSRVLDIGCYPLHLFHALEGEPFEFKMKGIASNHEPVKEKNIVQLNIEKEKLPFKSDSFDLVLMTEVIEHLTADPRMYLDEVRRVMKKNGRNYSRENLLTSLSNSSTKQIQMTILYIFVTIANLPWMNYNK